MFYNLPYDIRFKIMSYYPIVSEKKRKINEEIVLYHIELNIKNNVKKVLDEIIKNVISNLNI